MRRRVHTQDGMTLVEVLVAATILVVGVAFAITALNGSRQLTLKSERVDQGVAIGQREIERMRALPYENLATTTNPTSTADQPGLLGVLVAAQGVVGLKIDVPQKAEQFVPANAAGLARVSCIAPASVPNSTTCPTAGRISSGPTRGLVYRFVTYSNSCLNLTLTSVCANLLSSSAGQAQAAWQNAKRVTVVVELDPVRNQTTRPMRTDTVVAR